MRIFKPLLMLTLFLQFSITTASTLDDLKNVFKSYSGSSYINKPAVLNSQRSGHYTLGGASTRSPNKYLQPLSVSAPGLRMGCNGWDAHFGSMSHIKSVELKRFLNAVLKSGANYAFMIGLDTLCPMCKKTMDQLNKIAADINALGLSSCNSAALALGGLLPQTQATQKYLCPQIAVSSGWASDMAAANQGCGAENKSDEIYAKAKENKEIQDIVDQFIVDKGNLAWKILKKRNFSNRPSEDDDLRELVMSFSGSIILQQSGEQIKKYSYLPSLAGDKSLYDAMLQGGEAMIYSCDDTKECLQPTRTKKLTVPKEKSFTGLVEKHLLSIKNKLLHDAGEYTEPEMQLITSTKKIPLIKALSAQATHSFVFEVIDLSQYAEIIAVDIIDDYINELIDVIRAGSANINLGKEESLRFERSLMEAKRLMMYRRTNTEKQNTLTHDFIKKVQLIEKMTANEMSSDFMQMAKWAAKQGKI